MLTALTRLATHHHRRVLLVALIMVPILAIAGGRVEESLSVGGFVVPGSESEQAADILEEDFEAGAFHWALIVSFKQGRVGFEANDAAITQLCREEFGHFAAGDDFGALGVGDTGGVSIR